MKVCEGDFNDLKQALGAIAPIERSNGPSSAKKGVILYWYTHQTDFNRIFFYYRFIGKKGHPEYTRTIISTLWSDISDEAKTILLKTLIDDVRGKMLKEVVSGKESDKDTKLIG